MKCEILRNVGLDFVHDMAARVHEPIEIPKDLAEGETRDLPDDVAEVLITCGVARAVDKPEKPKPAAHETARHHTPPPPPAKK